MLNVGFINSEHLVFYFLIRPLVVGEKPIFSFLENRTLVVLGQIFAAEWAVALFSDFFHNRVLIGASDGFHVYKFILLDFFLTRFFHRINTTPIHELYE